MWAEAGRNPRVAAITRAIDADVLNGLERLMDAAKAAGVASPRLDPRFGARFFVTFVAGLFKRMAIEDDFDPEAETPMAVGVLKALFAGALSPTRPSRAGRPDDATDPDHRRHRRGGRAWRRLGGQRRRAMRHAACAERQNRSRQSRRLPGAGAIRG